MSADTVIVRRKRRRLVMSRAQVMFENLNQSLGKQEDRPVVQSAQNILRQAKKSIERSGVGTNTTGCNADETSAEKASAPMRAVNDHDTRSAEKSAELSGDDDNEITAPVHGKATASIGVVLNTENGLQQEVFDPPVSDEYETTVLHAALAEEEAPASVEVMLCPQNSDPAMEFAQNHSDAEMLKNAEKLLGELDEMTEIVLDNEGVPCNSFEAPTSTSKESTPSVIPNGPKPSICTPSVIPCELNSIDTSSLIPNEFSCSDSETSAYDPRNDPQNHTSDSDSDSENEVERSHEEPTESAEEPRPGTTKKRKRIPQMKSKVYRERQKMKREAGEEYTGIKKIKTSDENNNCGKKWKYDVPRPSRNLKIPCNCKLSLKGSLKCRTFSEQERKAAFSHFWNQTREAKSSTIASLIDVAKPKFLWNRKSEKNSRRGQTLKYHLKHNGERLRVCKKMFLHTFDIKEWYVLNCVNNNKTEVDQSDEAHDLDPDPDEETVDTSSTARTQKRHTAKLDALREFFESLPKMESHYCRQNTSKLYLEPIFQSKTEVYELYKKENMDKPDGPGIVCLSTFYAVFDELKLSIYVPRKDLCDQCVSYATGNLSKEDYDTHQARKMSAREEKRKDNEGPHFVATMDLQGVLLSPRLNASSLYYRMKLCVHNFTLFNNKTHSVKCYVWHEGEGGITSHEFATLTTSYIREQNLEKGQDVILWSDGAGYQNRNVNLSNALLSLSKELGITIIHKYLEVGHTQMECDSVHATVERKLRNKTISIPADYVHIIRSARNNPCPYEVDYIDHTFFQDFSKLGPLDSIRPGYKPGDPTVNQLRALKYSPSGELSYKLSFCEEWRPFEKRKRKKVSSPGVISRLYQSPLPIKPDKFQHLQHLKSVLEKDYHSFYDSLRH